MPSEEMSSEALNDENSQVCITATDALIEIGDVATDALMNSLDHEKVNVRCDATRALGEINKIFHPKMEIFGMQIILS